jgi:hypothetical protein
MYGTKRKRMPELLADMLIKLDKLDKIDILVEEMRDMKREQLRTTNAVWELSQMMQESSLGANAKDSK